MDKLPHFSDFLGLSTLLQLQLALKTLELLGLKRSAIEVDTAIRHLREELSDETQKMLETWDSEEWRTMDEMAAASLHTFQQAFRRGEFQQSSALGVLAQ